MLNSSSRRPDTGQIEMDALGRRHVEVGHLDEQQLLATVGIHDDAFLVAGVVGVVRQVGVPEHCLPPFRQLVGVGAVDRDVRDYGGHAALLTRPRGVRTAGVMRSRMPCAAMTGRAARHGITM